MKIFRFLFNRITVLILAAAVEVILIVWGFNFFAEKAAWMEAVLRVLSVIIAITIINNSRHLSSDMIWILVIVLFPVPGTAAYLLIGANLISSRTYRSLNRENIIARKYYVQDPEVMKEAQTGDSSRKGDIRYLSDHAGFPFYRNQDFDYYKVGEEGYPVMLEELKKAKEFIFLEYFIIEKGKMWDSIHDILKEKAEDGLDVRVMYDDFGSISSIPVSYARKLEKEGIQCIPFNRINPVIGAVMNHRDHRKILVIDGKTAFTGGINLADEYINEKEKYGYWKDNCVRVKGEAVWSFTVLFLTSWNALRKTDEDYKVFYRKADPGETDGWIAPYGQNPLNEDSVGQSVYMNILNSAENYVYIFTPYLIIDTDMQNALILAAERGVDVRIITPGIPDKKIIFQITRSFYKPLIAGGVKIYEYTPGFDHAKVFVSDDQVATVGTLNLDYRSLYLHFENGVYVTGSKEVRKIREDFVDSMEKSHPVNPAEFKENVFHSMFVGFVKLFASQM